MRTVAAEGQTPKIWGLEAPGAPRRTPHETHAGETWHMALLVGFFWNLFFKIRARPLSAHDSDAQLLVCHKY